MKPIRRSLVVGIMSVGTMISVQAQPDMVPPRPATPRAAQAPLPPQPPEGPAPTPRPAPRAYRIGADGLEPMELLAPGALRALDGLLETTPRPGAYRLAPEGLEPLEMLTPGLMERLAPLGNMAMTIPPMPPMEFAFFEPQTAADRAREQADRAREQVERNREQIQRGAEMVDRNAAPNTT